MGATTTVVIGDSESTTSLLNYPKVTKDAFHIAYIIYFTLGAGYLLPWNAFITAVDYFSYLYPDITVDRILAIIYMIANLVCLLFIVAFSNKSSSFVRINVGMFLFVAALVTVPMMDVFYVDGRVGNLECMLVSMLLLGWSHFVGLLMLWLRVESLGLLVSYRIGTCRLLSLELLLPEMPIRRGRGGQAGKGRGRGNTAGRHGNSGAFSLKDNLTVTPTVDQPSQLQPHSTTIPEPISVETQLSRNVEGCLYPSSDNVNSAGASSSTISKKKGRGRYRSMQVDMKTKYGGKIIVKIPDDIERAVGDGARNVVNYCGLVVRSTISFRDGEWPAIFVKYGQTMWLKVKDKFEIGGGRQEHVLQAFAVSTMQRLFRAWKTRLHSEYLRYTNDEDRLSHLPSDVKPEDWEYLIQYFGSPKFQAASKRNKVNRGKQITKHSCGSKSFAEVEEATRDPVTGEKALPDKVWELQHTRKKDNGEVVWSDPQSQEFHGQIQTLVTQQQSEENENPMTGDAILASVLGERTGYVRGKGYGKKPPRKNQIQQAAVDASVSSAMENMRQQMQAEMQAEMDRKLQEEREKLREEMDRRFQDQLKEEMDRRFQEQMAAMMSRIQQGQVLSDGNG